MPNLSVRRIDEDVYERLRSRAAEHGVSMEEEVRGLITRAVSAPRNLGTWALRCFGSENGVELELPLRQLHEPVDFAE